MKQIDLSRGMVFVTGGGGSIGGAICVEAARAGAKVAVADFNLDAAKSTCKEIEAIGGTALALEIDVTNRKNVGEVMSNAVAELGEMIGLVTGAAVLRTGPVAD